MGDPFPVGSFRVSLFGSSYIYIYIEREREREEKDNQEKGTTMRKGFSLLRRR